MAWGFRDTGYIQFLKLGNYPPGWISWDFGLKMGINFVIILTTSKSYAIFWTMIDLILRRKYIGILFYFLINFYI